MVSVVFAIIVLAGEAIWFDNGEAVGAHSRFAVIVLTFMGTVIETITRVGPFILISLATAYALSKLNALNTKMWFVMILSIFAVTSFVPRMYETSCLPSIGAQFAFIPGLAFLLFVVQQAYRKIIVFALCPWTRRAIVRIWLLSLIGYVFFFS